MEEINTSNLESNKLRQMQGEEKIKKLKWLSLSQNNGQAAGYFNIIMFDLAL